MEDSAGTSKTRIYRLEERVDLGGASWPEVVAWPTGRAEQAWRRFQHELRLNPTRYTPHSGRRLVLLGPDRVVKS